MGKYRIKVLSKITGVSIDTIRNWEKRYDFIQPVTSDQGEKLYSESDAELLRKINVLIKDGGRVSDIALRIKSGAVHVEQNKVSDEVRAAIEDYYGALLTANLAQVSQTEIFLEINMLFKNRLEHVYSTLLQRARKDCKESIIEPFQENFITRHITGKLIAFLNSGLVLKSAFPNDCKVVCANMSHALPEDDILTFACGIKLRGYNVVYLGHSAPLKDLDLFAAKIQPAVLVIGVNSRGELEEVYEYFKDATFPICPVSLGTHEVVESGQRSYIHLLSNYAIDKLEGICLWYFENFRKARQVSGGTTDW